MTASNSDATQKVVSCDPLTFFVGAASCMVWKQITVEESTPFFELFAPKT